MREGWNSVMSVEKKNQVKDEETYEKKRKTEMRRMKRILGVCVPKILL